MKKILLIKLLCFFAVYSFSQSNSSFDCIAKADAEKILGQAARLITDSSEMKNNIIKHTCTYMATSEDVQTHKTGNVYYSFEKYGNAESAKEVYNEIVAGNELMPGFNKLDGIGDEAFFHSDKINFHLLMFRKNEKVVRIKVNKVTSKTSLAELKRVVKHIASSI